MGTQRTPQLYAAGLYTLVTPFTIPASTIYSCQAIRSFKELVDAGVDIYGTYYQPKGLAEATFESDLTLGANLVSLMAAGAPTIDVPDTYIASYPLLGNVPYNQVVIAASLGQVPDGLDYTYLKEQITNQVAGVLGLTPIILVAVSPSTATLSPQQANDAEAARQSAITLRQSDFMNLTALQAQFTALQTKYAALQAFVISKFPNGTTP